jgi:hypothetical protein
LEFNRDVAVAQHREANDGANKKNAEGPANLPRLASKALISTAQRILLTLKIRNIQYGRLKLSVPKQNARSSSLALQF